MNEKARQSIDAYNAQAGKLCATYNKLATEDVLPGIRSILPLMNNGRTHFDALDLGCGSGRDAFWLASQGFHVVGVDASIEMIRNAWSTKQMAAVITYIEDEIPALNRVRARHLGYDFFLMGAVWMHLDTQERKKTIDLMDELARPGATAYISLRHGPSPADRPMFDTSIEEVRDLAADVKARFKILPATPDHLGRGDVTWDSVALQFASPTPHPAFHP